MTEILELKAADNDTVITSVIVGGNDEFNKLPRSLSEDERERLRILQRLFLGSFTAFQFVRTSTRGTKPCRLSSLRGNPFVIVS